MKSRFERGAALVLALMFLSLLSILGGALLSSMTLDVWIGDNYSRKAQSLYLAEAGLELARLVLHDSAGIASLLATAAGPDGTLSNSFDLGALKAADDRPLLTSGNEIGTVTVWLRNDAADGVTSIRDANREVTVLSAGEAGATHTVLEARLRKASFPPLPPDFPPDDAFLDYRLRTVAGLERLAAAVHASATPRFAPSPGEAQVVGNAGSEGQYAVIAVDGDCVLGPGTGYGFLLVRGNLIIADNFVWNGIVAVIGQGGIQWPAGVHGQLNGALFVARTRADDRSPGNILGTQLVTKGSASIDMSGAPIAAVRHDPAAIDKANSVFPFVAVRVKEH